MSLRVGEKAIKMSFIQTLPGAELEVAAKLEAACKQYGTGEQLILKGFGSFDIVLIYASSDFDKYLTKAGPIDGVLKTSRSFCYEYVNSKRKKFFSTARKKTFIGISQVKLSPMETERKSSFEKRLIERFADSQNIDDFVFGTLGWNDLILVFCGDEINNVLDKTLWSVDDSESDSVFKTYSFISLSYKDLPHRSEDLKSKKDIKNFLEKTSGILQKIPENIEPRVSITCLPIHSSDIACYWADCNFAVQNNIGKEDLYVKLKDKKNWADFLSDLLWFRSEYNQKIISTQTHLGQTFKKTTEPEGNESYLRLPSIPKVSFDYDFNSLANQFDEKSAASLAGTFNTLRGLLSNGVISDAFMDMVKYPEFIKNRESKEISDSHKIIKFAIQTDELIKRGAELRLYGTHGTLDETVGQFTKLRGGAHRSLLAIGFLPSTVLERVFKGGRNWRGFINAGSHQFCYLHEVINVPSEALWRPELWWATYHEIAHIIVDYLKDYLSFKLPEIQLFLTKKNYPDFWFKLVVELASEFIGYEIGFYGQYKLFTKKIWTYIYQMSPGKQDLTDLSVYVIRSYFVKLMESIVYDNTFDYEVGLSTEKTYHGLIEHMNLIENIIYEQTQLRPEFKDKYFIAANFAPIFIELRPWIQKHFVPVCKALKFRRNEEQVKDINTDNVHKSLVRGVPWYDEILYPEAVLLKCFSQSQPEFRQSIATVLTFCHLQKEFIEKDMQC